MCGVWCVRGGVHAVSVWCACVCEGVCTPCLCVCGGAMLCGEGVCRPCGVHGWCACRVGVGVGVCTCVCGEGCVCMPCVLCGAHVGV